MNHNVSNNRKNITIEGFKLFASLFVIFLHVPVYEKCGATIDALSRFAVPFFFIISGFFSFNVSIQTIHKRFRHIAKLAFFSSLFYLVRYSLMFLSFGGSVLSYFKSIFTVPQLLGWFLLNLNPIAEHLWFLSALLYCYAIFWIYTAIVKKKEGYLFLYILGSFILFCTLALDGPISRLIMYIPHYVYRNAWFMGISAFILGVFLHELFQKYTQVSQLSTTAQIFLIVSGLILAVLQKHTIGTAEISAGALIAASGLMLYCLTHPAIFCGNSILQRFFSKAGSYSTTVYIIHVLVIEIYDSHLVGTVNNFLGSTEVLLRPFLIFFVSLFIAILYDKLISLSKYILQKMPQITHTL